MQVRYSALLIGVLFLVLGIAGFIPGFISIPDSTINAPIDAPNALNTGYGYLFGLFPNNYLHNAVHLMVGVLGIAAFTSLSGSIAFLRGFAISYVAIVLFGLLPLTKTVFGTMPIYGNNVWLNALTAAIAIYYGFVRPSQESKLSSPSGV